MSTADTVIRPRVPWLNWPAWRRHGGGPPPPPQDEGITTEDAVPLLLTTEDAVPLTLTSETAP